MTENKFEQIEHTRVSQKVAEQIKKLIFDGRLQPGEKLQSERELSKMLGVGRFSLREGLRILESMGIVETKYGVSSGTYVTNIALEKLTDKISDIMRLGRITMDALAEARMEISLANLKYFHERADAEDMESLENCLEEAERLLKQGVHPKEKYIEFHRGLAQGSKNPVFLLLYSSLLDLQEKEALSKYACPLSHSRKFLACSKKILEHLKEKDLKGASSMMKEYLSFLKRSIESRRETPARLPRLKGRRGI